jgi:hypothetical protein
MKPRSNTMRSVLKRYTAQRYRYDSEPIAGKKPARSARAAAVSASLRTARGASIEVCEGADGHYLSYREVWAPTVAPLWPVARNLAAGHGLSFPSEPKPG